MFKAFVEKSSIVSTIVIVSIHSCLYAIRDGKMAKKKLELELELELVSCIVTYVLSLAADGSSSSPRVVVCFLFVCHQVEKMLASCLLTAC